MVSEKILKVFPIISHGNQSSNPISPLTLCSLMMLHMKFDLNNLDVGGTTDAGPFNAHHWNTNTSFEPSARVS